MNRSIFPTNIGQKLLSKVIVYLCVSAIGGHQMEALSEVMETKLDAQRSKHMLEIEDMKAELLQVQHCKSLVVVSFGFFSVS